MNGGKEMAEKKNKHEADSVSTHKLVEGSHVFKVTGHSSLMIRTATSWSKRVRSAPFQVGNHTWAVSYYPQWFGPYSSFYAVLLSESKNVTAQVQFELINTSTNLIRQGSRNGKYVVFDRKGKEHGKHFFISDRNWSRFLVDDSFTVRCTLRVLTSSAPKPRMPKPSRKATLPKLCSDLGELLASGEGADVTFEVKGKLFRAHKCILAARSAYFRTKFFGPMRKPETQEHTKVDDIEPTIFLALLCYIYTDRFPEMDELDVDEKLQLSHTKLAQKLLVLADQFVVDRLKSTCEDILCQEISNDNAAMSLVIAKQRNCGRLRAACAEFISKTKNMQLLMEEFQQIMLSCPSVLKDIKVNVNHQKV